jgi:polysaccharide deacetylase family protein (PEP-CTERM system associated)
MPAASSALAISNAMTVDVEDYFQVSAFEAHIRRDAWAGMESRVERNVDRILTLFANAGVTATFFTLGWVAERNARMVRRIAEAGHEIASHGYAHRRASEQTMQEFSRDIVLSKAILEDACGQCVSGYRAPSFSIGSSNLWALQALEAAGYRYSSSIYPIRHDHYGMPDAPRFPFRFRNSSLLEIPISTAQLMRQKLPAGGGGYFRLLPYVLSRSLIRRVNEADGKPAVFYFHPWEIDPGQPRQHQAPLKARFRHYLNLHRTEPRLRALLRDFRWQRMDRLFLEPS